MFLTKGLILIKYKDSFLDKKWHKKIPADIDYTKLKGLRLEAVEKLSKIKPENLGQASRISGVNPADIAALNIILETL